MQVVFATCRFAGLDSPSEHGGAPEGQLRMSYAALTHSHTEGKGQPVARIVSTANKYVIVQRRLERQVTHNHL